MNRFMSGQMLVLDYNLVTRAFSLQNGRGGKPWNEVDQIP